MDVDSSSSVGLQHKHIVIAMKAYAKAAPRLYIGVHIASFS